MLNDWKAALLVPALTFAGAISPAVGQSAVQTANPPWLDTKLDPDRRADLLLGALNQDQKILLLHGHTPFAMKTLPADVIWSSGFVPALPEFGVPPLRETDAGLGVAFAGGGRKDAGATVLPSGLAQAATWDLSLAYAGGAMIGHEAHNTGFNVMLAGGLNLAREPRNGRNFEYAGEDPLLAGLMVGQEIRGIQDQHVISTSKHFVLNAQETARGSLDARIDEGAHREFDLLAFQLAIETGDPGAIMCAYNRINGDFACENAPLLNGVLKGDWGYRGWVMSDWGATHSTEQAALSGLDQEQGEEFDGRGYFAKPLQDAVAAGRVPQSRIDDMVHRILRGMFAKGVVDDPAIPAPIDHDADAEVSRRVSEAAMVLLKNDGAVLPLTAGAAKIAVIGGHADVGVLAGGGGSSEVEPFGGPALRIPRRDAQFAVNETYVRSSPMQAIGTRSREVKFADGHDLDAAAALAKESDVAIVFVTQWTTEFADVPDLSLPNGQDDLIEAVAAANPHTIVVLETGGPVLMPWLDKVPAVIEAWYPGQKGGEVIARLLFGEAGPSARLPITFPKNEDQLPHPILPGTQHNKDGALKLQVVSLSSAEVDYFEGANVGYRWFESRKLTPLFPFGFGLTYTSFSYSNISVEGDATLTVSFDVTNTGTRAGTDTPQVYAAEQLDGATSIRHLVGWSKVKLEPGQTQRVTVTADPRLIASFDVKANNWHVPAAQFVATVAHFAGDAGISGHAIVKERRIKP